MSLKCGHLFGQSCIDRWIHTGGKSARCPQCNESAQKKDVRPIYVRNLKVICTAFFSDDTIVTLILLTITGNRYDGERQSVGQSRPREGAASPN